MGRLPEAYRNRAWQKLPVLLTVVTTVLWLVICWRAMRAHEKMALNMTRYVGAALAPPPTEFRIQNAQTNRLYKEFLAHDPAAAELPAKERHEIFGSGMRRGPG